MTERASRRAGRGWTLSPTEGRLYVVAGLAVVHLVVWRALTGTAQTGAPPQVAPAPHVVPAGESSVASPSQPAPRPAIAIPAGWRLASDAPTASAAPTVQHVRAPAARPLRVRTRSS